MADIDLVGLAKRFGDVRAVEDLTLAVEDGSFTALLGPTGAGKTTTLRLAAGLETPDRGNVFLGGRDLTRASPSARDVAFVFQQYSLYPHLSVFDNLAFPLRAPSRRIGEAEIRRKVGEIAELLRITAKLDNRATRLSGGEMQRVAIGRALVRDPQAYLMDEPLSSLDAKLRADLRIELKRIQIELGATFLYVTHDQIEALTMATKIGVMDHGRLVQIGSPREIYEAPVNLYVAARLGQPSINLLPRSLLPEVAAPPGAATIGARTEHMRISRERSAAPHGRVSWIEHLGDQNHLHIEIGGREVVSLVGADAELAVGDDVAVEFVKPLFFDAGGARLSATTGTPTL